jgi:hypothetical protein
VEEQFPRAFGSVQAVLNAALHELSAVRGIGVATAMKIRWAITEGKDDKSLADRELRSQVTRLAIEAYRGEEISRGRLLDLSKLLGISRTKLKADFAILGTATRIAPGIF